MKEFREEIDRAHAQVFEIEEVLHRGRTRHQDVLVFRNPTFGTVLALDGAVQLTKRDSHVYHEMMAHIPLVTHGSAARVLIVGGGDGGVLKEVLKHPVRQVVVAELDPEVMRLARRYFPEVSCGAFEDPRVSVVIGDAARHVADCCEEVDVIIVDSTDPAGPGGVLFREAFYGDCRALLGDRGVLAAQSGAAFYRPDRLAAVRTSLAQIFDQTRTFFSPVPTYANGSLALILAGAGSFDLDPPVAVLRRRLQALRGTCRFYALETHCASLTIAATLAGDQPAHGKALPSQVMSRALPAELLRAAE